MIEKGLFFLLGGLTALIILILLRRRSDSTSGDKRMRRESIQASNKTSRSLSVSADDRLRIEEDQNISAASLQVLYDLNKSLSSTLDTYLIIDQALSSAISILGGEKADYYGIIPETQELNLVRSIGRDLSEIAAINQLLSRGEIKKDLKWIQKHKKLFLNKGTGKDFLGEKGSVIDEEISTILSVPVLIDQELAGIISLLHTDENAYSLEQEELLSAIAHQAGLAINNSQRFVEVAFLLNSLKAKQELQDKLFEHLPVGVLLLDNKFQILSGNQLGYEIVNVLHPDFNQIVVSRLGNKTIQELADLSMEPLPIEVQNEEDPREVFEVQLRRAQTIEGGYWILMIADVTEERGIKNRIRVQERLATLGQFAAGITHDFNNILSAILVYSEVILRDSQLSEENRSRMNAVREQLQRATDLINRILDFSRDQPVEYKPFDLIPFLEQTRDLLIRIIPEDIQVNLDKKYSPETLPMRGDPARLQQMILNLALNARDAMPEGGTLGIQVEIIEDTGESNAIFPGMDPGNWILFQVKDTGIGIDPQDQPRIFEPFFTTKAAQGGTGLGLAQVYGIVKQHQGFIDLETAPGVGTTFKIYFPLITEEVSEIQESAPELELDGKGDLILVVEDDENLQKALWNLLEDYNYQVILAENGEKGFDIIEQIGEKISLVITDVVMPKMGGVEMYHKTRDIYPEKIFIFITGHPSKIKDKSIAEDPFSRLLLKPFSMAEILLLTKEIRSISEK